VALGVLAKLESKETLPASGAGAASAPAMAVAANTKDSKKRIVEQIDRVVTFSSSDN